ncbi:unnamed protein product [Camellia sinensis]
MGLILVSSMSWILFQFMHVVVVVFVLMGCSCLGGSGSSTHRHHVHVAGNETDRLALLAFEAEITGDPFGALNSWNESIYFCQWADITCGRPHQRVTKLNLDHRKLTGSISPHIGNLSFLRELWSSNNSFTHQIAPELGHLRNCLAGRLPLDLGISFPTLQWFSVGNNLFTGSIPNSISNATNLHHLDLGTNKFIGRVPPLGIMHNLGGLNFQFNHLGTEEAGDLNFLSSLPNATNLNFLRLGSNNFGGVLPESISNLSTNLRILYLDNNKIGGSIPTEMANLVNLQALDMSDNHFIGNILADIGKLQKLQILDL